jgi:1-acyl-sn-glycerol-3-phosphate acyltransferase
MPPMSFIKNILNLIYSAWCIATFFIVLFLLMFVYAAVFFMNDRMRTTTAYRANRVLSLVWLKICGYTINIEGAEKIDPSKTYMFIGNHSNMLDLPVTGYFLQHYYKSLVKKELKYVPLFGFLIKITSVPVNRSNPESRRHSTQVIVDKLAHGVSFLIFPEGTRNKTGQPLKSFYSGAFKTSIMAGVPIQPFLILDHRLLQPVRSFRFHPGHIRVKVLDAIETKGLALEEAGALQERIYKLMEAEILKEDKNFG